MNAPDCFAVLHPAYVLRVPQARATVVADLRRVRDRHMPAEPVPWSWWDGEPIPDVPLGFDIETDYDKKRPGSGDVMTQCAIATRDHVWVALHDGAYDLARQLEGKRHVFTLNGWNFDNPKCHALGILVPHGIDVTALAYLDDEAQPLGLESLAVKYLRVRGWKEERAAELGTPEFAIYNARDAWYTLRLAEHFWKLLGQRRRIVTEIMSPARLALDACTTRGAPLDLFNITAHRRRYDANIEHAERRVREYAGGMVEFNPNSTRHIAAVLGARGHVLPTTESGTAATDKGLLGSLDDDFARAVLAFRSARKALSTYVIPYQSAAEGRSTGKSDGRVHPTYTIWRTVTGRTSARDPNIQNVPRELKDIFPCVRVDYAAIEFILAAWCANARSILDRKRDDPEWDPHRFFAAVFYRKPEAEITKLERQVAKSANFSQLYMGNADTLVNYAAKMGLVLTLPQATAIHETWHRTFPEFRRWYAHTLQELETLGYSETATGFRRHYGDFKMLYGSSRDAALREGVNVKVQGLAAHVALIGLAACHRDGHPICGFIHDEFMFDYATRDAFEKDYAGIVRNMTQEPVRVLRERFGVDLSVPLSVEATVPETLA